MESEQFTGLPYHESALRLCFDGFERELLRGRVYGIYFESPITFGDMTSFLTKVDAMLDQLGIPQSYQKKRQFKNAARPAQISLSTGDSPFMTMEQVQAQSGKLATATLRITSRQKATWQGQLLWDGKEDIFSFRSDLELMRHIHHVMLKMSMIG